MTSPESFVVWLLVTLVLLGVVLAALHVVISSAVEQALRRTLPESSLRPSIWELRRRARQEDDW